MQTRRVSLSLSAACLLGAGPAFAAGGFDPKAALIASAVIPAAGVLVQFLVAILLPRFTLRMQRAIAEGFLPSAGWGALVATLAVIVAVVVGQGGAAGKALAGVVGVVAMILALAGGVGISKIFGDWAMRRWKVESMGPMTVLCGATVWAWGAAVPIFGWAAGLFSLIASLGAAVQVVLQPQAFDPPRAPAAPVDEPTEVDPQAPP